MTRLRLSPAQISALECRGIYELRDSPRLLEAWPDGAAYLEVPDDRAAAIELMDEVIEHSNGEDAHAEIAAGTESGRFAGFAARSLAAVATKICRAVGD